MSVRFIHTADWQIGMPFEFLSADAASAMRKSRLKVIETIRDYTQTEDIQFVLICGDLFDDALVSNELVSIVLQKISEFGCPVYVIAGNHEVKGGPDILRSDLVKSLAPENFIVLEPGTKHLEKFQVDLLAAPVRSTHVESSPLIDVLQSATKTSSISIAVGHGSVDSVAYSGESNASISLSDLERLVADLEIDYVALGDRHSFTPVGTSGRIFYSGAPEPTKFTEIDPGKFLDVTVEGKGLAPVIKTVSAGEWKFLRVGEPTSPHKLHSATSVHDLINELRSVKNKNTTAVKLYLDIHLTLTEFELWGNAVAQLSEEFACLIERDGSDRNLSPVIYEDAHNPSMPAGLTGYLRDAYEELLGILTSGTAVEQARARQALLTFNRVVGRVR